MSIADSNGIACGSEEAKELNSHLWIKMETFRLDWDKHEKVISEAFSSLRKDEHFSDVTLVCEERQFQAHKVVLSESSSKK